MHGQNSSTTETSAPVATGVVIHEDSIGVELGDGRIVTVPIGWYPRIAHASEEERTNWRLIGGGRGIHWPDLDEDISVENVLAGRPSGESQESLKKWLAGRGG